MRKWILSIVVLTTLQATAQDSLWQAANIAYEQGFYKNADSLYTILLNDHGPSAEVYYNLGNTCYKQEDWPRAILNYERCLQIDRRHKDAIFNLELSNTHLRDRIDPIEPSLLHLFWRDLCHLLPSGTWGWITLFFAWSSLGFLLLLLFSKNLSLRKTGLYGMFSAAALTILLLAITYAAHYQEEREQYAIIMQPSLILKSEPSESSTNLFVLHSGLKLRILDSDDSWSLVSMPDGNTGWVQTEAIENI